MLAELLKFAQLTRTLTQCLKVRYGEDPPNYVSIIIHAIIFPETVKTSECELTAFKADVNMHVLTQTEDRTIHPEHQDK